MGAPLSGGSRNDVRMVRIAGRNCVARQSFRAPAAIAWEVDLLLHLLRCGLRVPRPLEARDGRLAIDGLVVVSWIDGDEPRTDRDWREVAVALQRLHAATSGWPQRPGFASSVELLECPRGGDVDLTAMPRKIAALCRSAWAPLRGMPNSVVHGDPNPHNIRMSRDGVGLIDWDEARVDVSLLDLADLPTDLDVPRDALALARMSSDAWEVANSWVLEPRYARLRLERMMARMHGGREKPGG